MTPALRATLRFTLTALLLVPAPPAPAEDFSFALFGDTPYNDTERARLPPMLEAMAKDGIAFAVHDGDIKNGYSVCSDDLYLDRLQAFQAARFPLVYVPGDNEWTDCHGLLAGLYKPEERLRRLRQIFFSDNQTLGRTRFSLQRQGILNGDYREYVENVRWRRGRLLFVGLNIPGSENNFGDGDRPSPEFLARGKANRAWLDDSFALAHRERDAVVFVIIQANPNFEGFNARRQSLAYGDFLRQLTDLTLDFPGQVILVHGDSHRQHIDQPMRDPRSRRIVRKFTRIETFGSPYMGWTKVTVKDADTAPRLTLEVRPYH
ncbi:MAG: metallophosphoesterase family protein [Rhodocyclaceae bacterium]|nr:metallophosphoesterase family protein [Rhodocyclaceae bacterium]